MGAGGGVATRLHDAGKRHEGEDRRDDDERLEGGDLRHPLPLLVQVVQHELGADEDQDCGEAGRQVDEPVEKPRD